MVAQPSTGFLNGRFLPDGSLLMTLRTGRSDLCIAGVFWHWKNALPASCLSLLCEIDDFSAVVYTMENVAAKALADQISDLSSPTLTQFGRLLGRIEEAKVKPCKCNDRNRIIVSKRILLATGGSE